MKNVKSDSWVSTLNSEVPTIAKVVFLLLAAIITGALVMRIVNLRVHQTECENAALAAATQFGRGYEEQKRLDEAQKKACGFDKEQPAEAASAAKQ